MRVLFDARWIYERPSGIGVYAQEMLQRLPRMLPDVEFTLLFCDANLEAREMAKLEGLNKVSSFVIPDSPLSPWNQVRLPLILRRHAFDLFHSPNYMMPFWGLPKRGGGRCRKVVNIHDVIPLVVENYAPQSRTSRFRKIFQFCLQQSVRSSDCVITGSQASQRDMVRALTLSNRQASKIRVIYDGAGERMGKSPHAPIQTDEKSPRTLLYVGRMDPYKNVPGLVEAFAKAKRQCAFPLRLMVCGPTDPRYPEAEQLAERLGVMDDVNFTGFVTDAELVAAYSTADLLVHPSRYEGFGLQIIEAMKSGLPVCCTDGGSQPEIAGTAAVVVPAQDVDAMAAAIVKILQNPEQQQRMRLAGFEQAQRFTWEQCAEQTASLYRTLLSREGSNEHAE